MTTELQDTNQGQETYGQLSRERARTYPIWSKKSTEQWLGGGNTTQITPIIPVAKGPAKLGKLWAIAGNQDRFFYKPSLENSAEKKILIAHNAINTSGELAVLSKLIKHYKVYLWDGKNLAAASPLNSLADYWQRRKNIQVDFATNIKKQVREKHHLPTENLIVLDKQAWLARWSIEGLPHQLTLESLRKEDIQNLLQGFDTSVVTHIRITNLDLDDLGSLQPALECFPNLTTVEFWESWKSESFASYLEQSIPLLKGYHIERLIIDGVIGNIALNLPSTAGIPSLVLKTTQELESLEISIPKGEHLDLIIKGPQPKKCFVSDSIKVKPEAASEKFYVSTIRTKSPEQLRELLASETCKEVQALALSGNFSSEDMVQLATSFPNLQYLELCNYESDIDVTLNFPALERCLLESYGTVQLGNCPELYRLAISLHKKEYLTVQFTQVLPALQDLEIDNLQTKNYLTLQFNQPSKRAAPKDQNAVVTLQNDFFDYCPELRRLHMCDVDCELPEDSLLLAQTNLDKLAYYELNTESRSSEEDGELKERNGREREWSRVSQELSKLIPLSSKLQTLTHPGPSGSSEVKPTPCYDPTLPHSDPITEDRGVDFGFFSRRDLNSRPSRFSKQAVKDLGLVSLRRPDYSWGLSSFWRDKVLDRIQYDPQSDAMSFVSSDYEPSSLEKIPYQQQGQGPIPPGKHSGVWSANLGVGEDYSLPLTAPPAVDAQLQIYHDDDPGTEIGYYFKPDTQQYFVRVLKAPEDAKVAKVKLHYDFVAGKNYVFSPPAAVADETQSPTNSPELQAVLEDLFSDKKCTTTEKINALWEYCRNFKDEPLQGTAREGTLNLLIARIRQKVGTISDRVQAFKLLSLGIADVRIIGNGTYSYCEVRSQDGSWQPLDFGDGLAKEQLDQESIDEDRIRFYSEEYLKWVGERPIFDQKLCSVEQPVLIYLPKGTTAKQAKIAVLQALEPADDQDFGDSKGTTATAKPLFINHPNDLTRYWESYAVQSDRSRIKVPGPLQEIFQNGGKLVINFAAFAYLDLIRLQSLWEHNTWNQHSIQGPVEIIGLLHEDTPRPMGFAHKFTACTLEQPLTQYQPQEDKYQEPGISCRIDPDSPWDEQLLANVKFHKNSTIELIPGPLLQAVEKNCPLTIENCPTDPQFQQLWDQIETEQQFYFNGELKPVPAQTILRDGAIHPQEHGPVRPKERSVSKDTPSGRTGLSRRDEPVVGELRCFKPDAELKGERIYLHVNNWDTLYEEIHYNEKDHTVSTEIGKLEQFKDKSQQAVFYVTQPISSAGWEQLAHYIFKHFPGVPYQFQLAPGITGPGVTVNAQKAKSELLKPVALTQEFKLEKNSWFTSNDPDYLAEKLRDICSQSHTTSIIDLTPQLTVSDLLVSVTPLPSAKKHQDPNREDLLFKIQKEQVFTALEAGETVILNGTISPRLHEELASAFAEEPYLEFNHQRHKFSGRLIIVEPKTSRADINAISCDFTPEDYAQDLLAEESKKFKLTAVPDKEKEQAIVENLLKYFKAAKFPHRGDAMPKDIGMTWQRLVHMKRALLYRKKPLHSHNPIKGFMLDDYAKDSEYYAFLNILVKFLFDKDDQQPQRSPIRREKYQEYCEEIKAKNAESKTYAWRLLNTCDGATLRKLLKENWLEQFFATPSTPFLANSWNSHSWSETLKALEAEISQDEFGAEQETENEEKEVGGIEDSRSYRKMNQRLYDLIDEEPSISQVIIIKGNPGVGKTNFLNQLQDKDHKSNREHKNNGEKYSCHEGLADCKAWLKDKTPGKIKLLIWDEANTNAPEVLNFLKGIHSNRPIFLDGEFYQPTPQHKIVAAVNPEWYSGRHYQDLLRFGGETIQLQMPDKKYLKKYLTNTYKVTEALADYALIGADLFKKYEPLTAYSFRDLQSLMQRYKALRKAAAQETKEAKTDRTTRTDLRTLYAALCGEFALCIEPAIQQQRFRAELAQALQLEKDSLVNQPAEPFQLGSKLFPQELNNAQQALQQALLIRNSVLEDFAHGETANLAFKRGLVLQSAAPGIGKNSLIKAVLEDQGYQATKDYYEVTAGDEDFGTKLDQAWREGAILVVKNLNLLKPSEEAHLGAVLTKINLENPGLLVLAQQNFSTAGTNPLSPALCNRLQLITLPEPSRESLAKLAEHQLPKPAVYQENLSENSGEGRAFVEALRRCHKQATSANSLANVYEFFSFLEYMARKMLGQSKPAESGLPSSI